MVYLVSIYYPDCWDHSFGLKDGAGYGHFFFFQAEDCIRDLTVTGVQTCALPISCASRHQDVQRVGCIAFRGEDAAKWKRCRHEMAYDQGPGVFGEKPQDREIVEDACFSHAATPGLECGRAEDSTLRLRFG